MESGEKNTVEIITSDRMKPLTGRLASNSNIKFSGGRDGMLRFLSGQTGMLLRDGESGEFVIPFDSLTDSKQVPPSATNNIAAYGWRNSQSYDIAPTVLDNGTMLRMQVTNTAYGDTSIIPMGHADVRIQIGSRLA